MIFLRHPTPDVPSGTCYGHLDLGLSAAAPKEILRAVNRLKPPRRLASSPLRRCLGLAEAISDRFGIKIETDDRLKELNFGAWEGRHWDRISRFESDPWAEDPMTQAPPGGETFAALIDRVGGALDDLSPETVVVTHAGPIRAARMILSGASFDHVFGERVPYAVPIRILRRAA